MPKIKTIRGIENRKVISQKEWLAARSGQITAPRTELVEAVKKLLAEIERGE